jgi:RNA polymerase sigma factor (sigma-70 family)
MLSDPEDAQDAAQEILLKIASGLMGYRGESAFSTWVYRVACNHLLNTRQRRAEQRAAQMGLSFETLDHMLETGLAFEEQAPPGAGDAGGVEQGLLEEEVKLGCTQSMVLCLDREHRLAFILADVLGLSGEEGAAALGISSPAFRKRLSRARGRMRAFMTRRCGLVVEANACRCARQVPFALRAELVDPRRLRYATHPVSSDAAAQTQELERLESVTSVFRAHPAYAAPAGLGAAVGALILSGDYRVLGE